MIYQTLLSGNLEATSSRLEHAVVPALAVIDWVVFGPGLLRQRWWTPLSWLILPICYLGVCDNVRDRSGGPLYPFLDPDASSFWRWVAIMIGVFLVAGFVLWAVGLMRSARSRPVVSLSAASAAGDSAAAEPAAGGSIEPPRAGRAVASGHVRDERAAGPRDHRPHGCSALALRRHRTGH